MTPESLASLERRLRDTDVTCVTPTKPCRERPGVSALEWCDPCAKLEAAEALASLRSERTQVQEREEQPEPEFTPEELADMQADFDAFTARKEAARTAIEDLAQLRTQVQGLIQTWRAEAQHSEFNETYQALMCCADQLESVLSEGRGIRTTDG